MGTAKRWWLKKPRNWVAAGIAAPAILLGPTVVTNCGNFVTLQGCTLTVKSWKYEQPKDKPRGVYFNSDVVCTVNPVHADVHVTIQWWNKRANRDKGGWEITGGLGKGVPPRQLHITQADLPKVGEKKDFDLAGLCFEDDKMRVFMILKATWPDGARDGVKSYVPNKSGEIMCESHGR